MRNNIIAVMNRRKSPDSESFHRNFWKSLSPSSRMEAAWQLVLDYCCFKGDYEGQQRLQRSVTLLKRRKS